MAGEKEIMSDYYPETDTENTGTTAADESLGASGEGEGADADTPESQEQTGESTLVPKSLFGADVAPGSTVSFKVVHVYDNEVEVEMVGEKEEEASESPMAGAMQKMEAMAMAPKS